VDEISLAKMFELVGLVIAGVLPIANPLSTAPPFGAVVSKLSDADGAAMARRVFFYFIATLFTALLSGLIILEIFGISIAGLQTAGGLIILYIGFRMLFPVAEENGGASASTTGGDPAFVPFTMPMLSGPGSISVVIGMASRVDAEATGMAMTIVGYSMVMVGIVICGIICWMVLRASGWLMNHISPQAVDAVTRLMGFVLICVAVEFLQSGIFGFIENAQL
jgi:multiple antibiotic resistance protein